MVIEQPVVSAVRPPCPLWVPEVKPYEAFTVWCLNLLRYLVYGKFLGLISPYIQMVFYLSFYWLFSSTTVWGHYQGVTVTHPILITVIYQEQLELPKMVGCLNPAEHHVRFEPGTL